MTGTHTPPRDGAALSEMPTGVIPVLTEVVPDSVVSQDLLDALDSRVQDKRDWMALEAQLLQTLRPEMERLTTELVRNSFREAWIQRSRLKI